MRRPEHNKNAAGDHLGAPKSPGKQILESKNTFSPPSSAHVCAQVAHLTHTQQFAPLFQGVALLLLFIAALRGSEQENSLQI